jgi:phage shock protein C
MKKLYRSKENKIFFGILGGIGEYAEVDPSLLRVVFLLLFFLTAGVPCILFYLFSALVVPKKT